LAKSMAGDWEGSLIPLVFIGKLGISLLSDPPFSTEAILILAMPGTNNK